MPTRKRHSAPERLQSLTSSAYRGANLLRVIGSPDFSRVCAPQSCALRQPAPPARFQKIGRLFT